MRPVREGNQAGKPGLTLKAPSLYRQTPPRRRNRWAFAHTGGVPVIMAARRV
jgi:hypothetical protein